MGKIVLLDELTINQIAAGEVIERPASVVKELIENSIDAGADNVTVEIKNGGISYIRVTDNGKGFQKDDMEIAFERHATSKIRKAKDLEEVKSMGFRGEALASIAAIAKVELVSRTKDDDIGYKVSVEGGKILESQEEGCMQGTSITITELFYNTPVRYKFLKRDFTEAGYIEDAVTRIALSYPKISIKLINSGKTVIHTTGTGELKQVIYNIYGRDIAENLIPVEYDYEDMKITGVIGKPAISRSNRANQMFFVNNRFVKDKTLTSAADQGFKGMLTIGKHGFLVLNIEMDPKKVDVNVHPAKLEVRFSEEQSVFKAVYHTIKENLLKTDLVREEISEEKKEEKAESENISSDEMKMQELKKELETEIKKQDSLSDLTPTDILKHISEGKSIEDLFKTTKNSTKVEDNKAEDNKDQIENTETENKEEVKEDKKEGTLENQDTLSGNMIEDIFYARNGLNQTQKTQTDDKVEELDVQYDSAISKLLDMQNQIKNGIYEGEIDKEKVDVKTPDINFFGALNTNTEKETDINKEEESNEKINENTITEELKSDTDIKEEIEDRENTQVNTGLKEQIEEAVKQAKPPVDELSKKEKEQKNEETFEEMYQRLFGRKVEDSKKIKEENPYAINAQPITGESISLFGTQDAYDKPKYKFIGIIFKTYIILELNNEMYLLDQHAAHERIMYEKVKKNYYSDSEKDSQLMLLPDVITLTGKEMGIAKDNIDLFRKAGFVVDVFGENTMKLSGVPTFCMDLDTKELFLETLDEINTVARTAKQEIEEKFLATVACKAAVKANMALSQEEVNSLMTQLLRLPNPFTCPHGRPTVIKMSKTDLEKKFARIQ